jgi:hypothetical protein
MPAPAAADLAKNWRRLNPPNFDLIMVSLLLLRAVTISKEWDSVAGLTLLL